VDTLTESGAMVRRRRPRLGWRPTVGRRARQVSVRAGDAPAGPVAGAEERVIDHLLEYLARYHDMPSEQPTGDGHRGPVRGRTSRHAGMRQQAATGATGSVP